MADILKDQGQSAVYGLGLLIGGDQSKRSAMANKAVQESPRDEYPIAYNDLARKLASSKEASQCKARPGDELLEEALATHRRDLMVEAVCEFADGATYSLIFHAWSSQVSKSLRKTNARTMLLTCVESIDDCYWIDFLVRSTGIKIFFVAVVRSDDPSAQRWIPTESAIARTNPVQESFAASALAQFFAPRSLLVCSVSLKLERKAYFSGEMVLFAGREMQIQRYLPFSRYEVQGDKDALVKQRVVLQKSQLALRPPRVIDILKMALDRCEGDALLNESVSISKGLNYLFSPATYDMGIQMLRACCAEDLIATASQIFVEVARNRDRLEVFASACEELTGLVPHLVEHCLSSLKPAGTTIEESSRNRGDGVIVSCQFLLQLYFRALVKVTTIECLIEMAISLAQCGGPSAELFVQCVSLCVDGMSEILKQEVLKFPRSSLFLEMQKVLLKVVAELPSLCKNSHPKPIEDQLLNSVKFAIKSSECVGRENHYSLDGAALLLVADGIGVPVTDSQRSVLCTNYLRHRHIGQHSVQLRKLKDAIRDMIHTVPECGFSPSLWAANSISALPVAIPDSPLCTISGGWVTSQILRHACKALGLRQIHAREPCGSLDKSLLDWTLRDGGCFVLPLHGGKRRMLCQFSSETYLVRTKRPPIVYRCCKSLDLPDETVLDVEVVDGKYVYASDALLIGGSRLWHKPYSARRMALSLLTSFAITSTSPNKDAGEIEQADVFADLRFSLRLKPSFSASHASVWVPSIFGQEAVVQPIKNSMQSQRGAAVLHALDREGITLGYISKEFAPTGHVKVRWQFKQGLPAECLESVRICDLLVILNPPSDSTCRVLIVPDTWYTFGKDSLVFSWPSSGVSHKDLLVASATSAHCASDTTVSQEVSPKHPAALYDYSKLESTLRDLVTQAHVACYHDEETGLDVYNYKQDFAGPSSSVDIRMCRGLVIHSGTQQVVAMPFVRFFDEGEQHLQEVDSGDLVDDIADRVVLGTMKLDGSMIAAFKWLGQVLVTSRSRMDSWQAKWARAWLLDASNCNATAMEEGCTYIFEAVYQDNRVIVPYSFDSLILLSITDSSGRSLAYEETNIIAENLGVAMVPATKARVGEFRKIAEHIGADSFKSIGAEGWVLTKGASLSKQVAPAYKCAASNSVRGQVHPLAIWNAARKNAFEVFLSHLGLQSHFESEARSMYSALRRSFYDVRDALCDPAVRLRAFLRALITTDSKEESALDGNLAPLQQESNLKSDVRRMISEVMPALTRLSGTDALAEFAQARITCRHHLDDLARAVISSAKELPVDQHSKVAQFSVDLCRVCPEYAGHQLISAFADAFRSELVSLSEGTVMSAHRLQSLLAVVGKLSLHDDIAGKESIHLREVAKDLWNMTRDLEISAGEDLNSLIDWLADRKDRFADDDENVKNPCRRCGCSFMFDADHERLCWCDSCSITGCTNANRFSNPSVAPPQHPPQQSCQQSFPINLGYPCLRCGCSFMFDADHERLCWCDSCSLGGCTNAHGFGNPSVASLQQPIAIDVGDSTTSTSLEDCTNAHGFGNPSVPSLQQPMAIDVDDSTTQKSLDRVYARDFIKIKPEWDTADSPISLQLLEHSHAHPKHAQLTRDLASWLGVRLASQQHVGHVDEDEEEMTARSLVCSKDLFVERTLLVSALVEQLIERFDVEDTECRPAWRAICEAVVNADAQGSLQRKLATTRPDQASLFRAGIFDCLRPRRGVEIRGYVPSVGCRLTWAKGWPSFDPRSLGLEVEPFMQRTALVGVFSMLTVQHLASSCSVSVWWRRVVRQHFLEKIHSQRREIERIRAAAAAADIQDDSSSDYRDDHSYRGSYRDFDSDFDDFYGYPYSRAGSR